MYNEQTKGYYEYLYRSPLKCFILIHIDISIGIIMLRQVSVIFCFLKLNSGVIYDNMSKKHYAIICQAISNASLKNDLFSNIAL